MFAPLVALALGTAALAQEDFAREDVVRETSAQGDLAPNYARRMLSPIEGAEVAPRLLAVRRTMPVRVGVIADPELVTEARLDAVRSACGRWARAMGGALRFAFVRVREATDADVIFTFGRVPAGRTLKGMTTERFGWAAVDLAVEDAEGAALPLATVVRVATHEMGHALGIWGHSPDAGDVMSIAEGTSAVSLADANTLRLAYREREAPATGAFAAE